MCQNIKKFSKIAKLCNKLENFDSLGAQCMLNVKFETVFEKEIRLKENVLHGNEVFDHSNETEIRRYEMVFHKNDKKSH